MMIGKQNSKKCYKMGKLIEEVKIWNTPLLGAFMLWRFSQGYQESHLKGEAPIGILHFIANGIFTNEKLLNGISNSRPNLQSYVRGFEDAKESDLLLSIHERIKLKRMYTLQSIDIAVSEGLVVWEKDSGRIYPRQVTAIPKRGNALKVIHQRNGFKAEILGKWFADHTLSSITNYLKIVL